MCVLYACVSHFVVMSVCYVVVRYMDVCASSYFTSLRWLQIQCKCTSSIYGAIYCCYLILTWCVIVFTCRCIFSFRFRDDMSAIHDANVLTAFQKISWCMHVFRDWENKALLWSPPRYMYAGDQVSRSTRGKLENDDLEPMSNKNSKSTSRALCFFACPLCSCRWSTN